MFLRLIAIVFCLFRHSEAASLCYFESQDTVRVTPLTEPLNLLQPPFNVNLTTVVYTFGYNGTTNGYSTIAIINAYLQYKERNDINVVLLDWEQEARISIPLRLLGTVLQYPTTAIPNAKRIGDEFGAALLKLSERGLDLNKVHLVGHSLGAHLMGYAGKVTKSQGKIISRITGLDAAGPLFEGLLSTLGLQSGDASFVDVIHTNPIFLGTPDSIGDVDIWCNCYMMHQPGCPQYYLETCSHFRAVFYFAESINSVRGFAAKQARSCRDWTYGINNGDMNVIFIGENTDRQARGNFYLRTNRFPPFARGLNGIEPYIF